jgi:hypothetical protein
MGSKNTTLIRVTCPKELLAAIGLAVASAAQTEDVSRTPSPGLQGSGSNTEKR